MPGCWAQRSWRDVVGGFGGHDRAGHRGAGVMWSVDSVGTIEQGTEELA